MPQQSDVYEASVALHRKARGKIALQTTVPITDRRELSLAYSPGVAEPCRRIQQDPTESFALTWRGHTVAVISDGSAVLGLGNIGPAAALPVMEGKAALLKAFGGVDAVPLVIDTQDSQEIIRFVRQIAPSFAGINLEDIAAPRCFEIEHALQDLGIPVFHDDQHGTAIVVMAALLNAARVLDKEFSSLRVVIVGAGAAGLATAQMLLGMTCDTDSCQVIEGARSVADLKVVDSRGIIASSRKDLNAYKKAIAAVTNTDRRSGDLAVAVEGADVVIGVSQPGLITAEMIGTMAQQPIVMALSNPIPEIMPDEAQAAGAAIVATGRSDFPNQINNVLAFPGIFRAVIEHRLPQITVAMRQQAAAAIAGLVDEPSETQIIPDPFDTRTVPAIVEALRPKQLVQATFSPSISTAICV